MELVYVRLDNHKMSENPIFQGSILRKDKMYDAKKNLVKDEIEKTEKIYVFLTNLSQTMSTLTPSIFNLPSLSVSSSFKK